MRPKMASVELHGGFDRQHFVERGSQSSKKKGKPMEIEFFNFGSNETFHFFKWITESGQVDLQSLIDEAFKRAETDDFLEMGMGVCETVRPILADVLEEKLDDIMSDMTNEN